MADGFLNKCKSCTKKDVSTNRRLKHLKYKDYDRKRSSDPKREKVRQQYQKTESYKTSHNKASKKWRDLNKKKRLAHIEVMK